MHYAEWESPLGVLTLVGAREGLCRIGFGAWESQANTITCWAKHWLLQTHFQHDESVFSAVIAELEAYFDGQCRHFTFPYSLYGTPFQKKVWQELLKIPYGETRSYKEVASGMGQGKAVRAIGNANNKNPLPIIIPCHRVLGSNGALVGYSGGLERKAFLLELEKQSLLRAKGSAR